MKEKVSIYNNLMHFQANRKILLKNHLIQVDLDNHSLNHLENQTNNIILINKNFIHHILMHFHLGQLF